MNSLKNAPRYAGILGSLVAAAALLVAPAPGSAQTTVKVDSTKNWTGWMNVYENLGGFQGGYLWGSGWGLGDLRAYFTSTNYVTMVPCTNISNVTDPYWVNPDGTGAKWMEANFYVDVGTAFQGQVVTFVGNVLTNTAPYPYIAQAFIKEFGSGYSWVGMSTAPLVEGSGFEVARAITPGNICQYGLMLVGPNVNATNLASFGQVNVAVDNEDPSVGTLASQLVAEGQTAQLAVTVQGTAPFGYSWATIVDSVPVPIVNGGRISGATTGTLTISNVVPSDAGTYQVVVTNSRGSASRTASLGVVPLTQIATNLLSDPGFEQTTMASDATVGWFNFGGSAKQNTNNFYYNSVTPVVVVEGTNCVQTYPAGVWNGFFQDRPAQPGQVYTADCWFLTPTEDPIAGSNTCYLEVQFRNAADGVLVQYASATFDTNFPLATWVKLTPTNINSGDFTTFLGTSQYLVAPAGTAKLRYQITYHGLGGPGSVYVDAARLMLEETPVTATSSAGNVQLTFPTIYGINYQVYYRTSLTETVWHTLGSPVPGTGGLKTVSDSTSGAARFYTVNTQ